MITSIRRSQSSDQQSSDQSSDQQSSDQSFYTNAIGPLIPPPPKPPVKEEAPDIKMLSSTFNAEWVNTINNPSHSDVVFRLEGKTYHAHRYVLASASDLFRQLLGVTKKLKVRFVYLLKQISAISVCRGAARILWKRCAIIHERGREAPYF